MMTGRSKPLYAARLNAFRLDAARIWPGKNRITTIDLLERAASAGNRRASIVTMGAEGVVLSSGGGPARYEPAHKLVGVSMHGAGDLFTGALAARLALGSDMPDAIRYAQAAAALHVSRHDRRG